MHHTDPTIQAAIVALCDALVTHERSTGQGSALVIRDAGGFVLRVIDGKPIPADLAVGFSDASILRMGEGNDREEELFLAEVAAEHARAVAKFPRPDACAVALMEEVGELAKAMLDEPAPRVRAEAVQVATMAMRCALQGDPTLAGYRARSGADDDLPAQRAAAKAEAKRLAAAGDPSQP